MGVSIKENLSLEKILNSPEGLQTGDWRDLEDQARHRRNCGVWRSTEKPNCIVCVCMRQGTMEDQGAVTEEIVYALLLRTSALYIICVYFSLT